MVQRVREYRPGDSVDVLGRLDIRLGACGELLYPLYLR